MDRRSNKTTGEEKPIRLEFVEEALLAGGIDSMTTRGKIWVDEFL